MICGFKEYFGCACDYKRTTRIVCQPLCSVLYGVEVDRGEANSSLLLCCNDDRVLSVHAKIVAYPR